MENVDIDKLNKFLSAIEYNERIALVTSGGTPSKISKYLDIVLDKSSTDRKGVEYAEELLKKGYHVIFLYKENSNTPFIHHTTMPEMFRHTLIQNGELIFLDNFKQNLMLYKNLSEKYSKNLILIPFTELEEYKKLLSFLVSRISSFQERSLIILAASINKFDVSEEDINKVVINERDSLSLTLVPNVLDINYIKQKAIPKAMLFDLIIEPNESNLFSMSEEFLEKFKLDYVIANTQENRYDKVYLIRWDEKFEIFKDELNTIDEKLISMVVSLHNVHVQKCNYH